LCTDNYFKELCVLKLCDRNKKLLLEHSFKIRDLETGQDEKFDEDVEATTTKIKYTTRLEKSGEIILSDAGSINSMVYDGASSVLECIDQLVLQVVIYRARGLVDGEDAILRISCNGEECTYTHEVANVNPYWNQVFYLYF
jgi:hypothetical protein